MNAEAKRRILPPFILFFVAWTCLLPGILFAGNGPHNWLVVYDPGDPHGVAIARYYQEARGFPDRNLVAYSFPRRATGSPSLKHQITGTECWAFIGSLRATITARGLEGQIHGITLVGNAPNSVKTTTPDSIASISSALFFAPGTTSQAQWEARTNDTSNIFRGIEGPPSVTAGPPATEIRSDLDFAGEHYWLATHLGFTGIRALRADEVFTLIDRSRGADGTAPKGTIYWPLNGDVRSTTREPQAAYLEPEWISLGLDYHIYGQSYGGGAYSVPQGKTGAPGSVPLSSRAVQGAICGVWVFELDSQPSLYTPGAIAEQLTSFGGVMGGGLDWIQSECALWLRAGAAGTSGAVTEPTANAWKFPHARIHSHYFNGATLAEAFLISLQQPWQTLVMGDGLTQPYAKIPVVTLSGITGGMDVSGTVTLGATATGAAGVESNLDLVIDGRVINIGALGEPVTASRVPGGFQIDTTTLPDGWHELRVIAYAANAVRSQGFATRNVTVNNGGGSVALSVPATANFGSTFSATATPTGLSGVTSIEIRSLGQVLATLGAAGGTAAIPASKLSCHSPSRLIAVAKFATGSEVSSAPQQVQGVWPPMAAQPEAPILPGAVAVARIFTGNVSSGFNWNTATPVAVVPVNDRWAIHAENKDQWPFLKDPVNKGGGIEFVTRFFARETGVYDFVLEGASSMGLTVDGVDLVAGVLGGSPIMPSAALAAGWHDVRLRTAIPTGSNANLWQFEPAFRARYTKRFHHQGWPVEEFEIFSLAHCAAPVMATTQPQLSARATGAGAANLTWNDPFASETGWQVERFIGDPGVSLVQYLGTKTPPTLVGRESAEMMRPRARTANDSTERFTLVPPWLQEGSRLLAADADALAGATATLYRVAVPAGTTVYAILRLRNTPPSWMTTQGGWTKISAWDTGAKGNNVQSDATSLWQVWKKEITAAGTIDLGGLGTVSSPEAISFVFQRTGAAWETIASPGAGATTTSISGLGAGVHRLRVTAQLPPSASIPSNEVLVDLTAAAANGTPSVSAGPDLQVAGTELAVSLCGQVGDDGQPGALTSTWSVLSGPGTVAFANSASPSTTATFSAPGTYTLQLATSDGEWSATDTAVVTVTGGAADNAAPAVNAGPDQSIIENQSITLSGSATDDGLPNPPGVFNYLWRQTGGPATVTFDNVQKPAPKVFFQAPGTYTLELTVSDGQKSGADTVQFIVGANPNHAPVVSVASSTATAVVGIPLALSATLTDDGLPNPPGRMTTEWIKVVGPDNKTATFDPPNAASTNVTFSDCGEYVLRVNATDGEMTSGQNITVTVGYNNAGNQPPSLTLPQSAETLFFNTVLVDFSCTDDGLPNPPAQLSYSWEKISGPGIAGADIYYGAAGTHRAALTFDQPGLYAMRLTASDGLQSDAKTITITVLDQGRHRRIWGWGRNNLGQIGPFEAGTSMSRPYLVGQGWTTAAFGSDTTLAMNPIGSLLGSGYNDASILGDTPSRKYFETVPLFAKAIALALSKSVVAAVKADGTVWTWGNGILNGELGDGAFYRTEAGQIPSLSGITQVFGKSSSLFAVNSAGMVWAWGANSYGKLGLGDTTTRRSPESITAVSEVGQIAQGEYHTLFLKKTGTVWGCGQNESGQVGNGGKVNQLSPVQVLKSLAPITPLTGIRKVVAGFYHSMALDDQGRVWAWGENSNMQLGTGNNIDLSVATQVGDPTDPSGFLAGITDIACSDYASFAVKSDGSAVAWGGGSYNMFGADQPTANRSVPGPVGGLPPVSAIWAGGNSVFAATAWATYEDFVARHFSAQETQEGKSAPDFDFLGSGRNNLLAYALNQDPKGSASPPPLRTWFENNQLVLESEYLAVACDLMTALEVSTDLVHWSVAQPVSSEVILSGDIVRSTLRFSLDQPRLFFRIKTETLNPN